MRLLPTLLLAFLPLFNALSAPPAPPAPPAAVTPDGGRYFGPLVDGKRHGKGRVEWDSGAQYEGGFERGLYSGRGKYKGPAGDIYEGEFRLGAWSGKGKLTMVDGSVYTGEFARDTMSGQGKLVTRQSTYTGQFRNGQYHGKGELTEKDGTVYKGEFANGLFHGKGRWENKQGEVYEGDFAEGEFTGQGTRSEKRGVKATGQFLKWQQSGEGRYEDGRGTVYEGRFVDGALEGRGRMTAKNGARYEGEFKNWLPHGKGELKQANGDVYVGGFEFGVFSGKGTLTYAKPQEDGRKSDTGDWKFGALAGTRDEGKSLANVEAALYGQRKLLDQALAGLKPRHPGRINLYLLSVGGDGAQEVFRREVEFVRDQFRERFGTGGRSLELVNSRTSVERLPMATQTSIRESLKAIAQRMDREQDILFLFITSHGSPEHEVALTQNHMSLRGLPAKELAAMLKEAGIRWKVVVVSACFGGGFIDPLKDDRTLVLAAARHDRQSFGCSDDNDFTYFGRAFFKEALPKSQSFQDAFRKAEGLVREWEVRDQKAAEKSSDSEFSLPQMHVGSAIERHLKAWWAQPKSP